MRARTLIVAAVVCTALAPSVHALIPDPVESALLAKIAAALQAIHEFQLRTMDKLNEQLYNRLRGYAFPARLFDPIRATAATVVDIRRQIERLGCSWPTSWRTVGLHARFSTRVEWCRDEQQDVWGSHQRFWDAPVQELNDYTAALTANMLSERAERTNTSWVRAHHDLFAEHTVMRNSPGQANRAEAAALAWAHEIAVGNGQIVTQNLLVRQMARDLDRFDAKKAADLTYYSYRGITTMAGRRWRTAPPDPSEELR